MQETAGWQYWIRTEKNVLDSDGTLILPGENESKGTALTIRLARKHGRPLAVIYLDCPDAAETVRAWIAAHKITRINIAGPRESGAPGIARKTRKLLSEVLANRQEQIQLFQEAPSIYQCSAECSHRPDQVRIA